MKKINSNKKKLSPKQCEELLKALKARFEKNMNRHKGLEWAKVQTKLEADIGKLWSLNEMERTGGEPDVVGYDKKTGEYLFYDCSAESPKGRRSVCYDREALLRHCFRVSQRCRILLWRQGVPWLAKGLNSNAREKSKQDQSEKRICRQNPSPARRSQGRASSQASWRMRATIEEG